MKTAVRKWGNSLAVRLPKAVAESVELYEGTPVVVEKKDGRLLLTPLKKKEYSLASLVRGINSRNRHDLIETGAPRGKEIW
jgi:antitoxin MazE